MNLSPQKNFRICKLLNKYIGIKIWTIVKKDGTLRYPSF